MRTVLRSSLAGLLGMALLLPLAARAEKEPSVEDMINALAPKSSAATDSARGETVPDAEGKPRPRGLTRSSKPSAPPPTREGRLQLQVQFDYASSAISPASRALLERLSEAMKAPALGELRYRIEGHTDITGQPDRNQRLSERRADAVADFLKSASGVGRERMNPIGLGSASPANPNDLKAAENRRVVIVSVERAPADAAKEGAGVIERLKGSLYARREGASRTMSIGARVSESDVLTTPANSIALVKLDDGAQVLLRSDTTVEFRKLRMSGEPGKMGQVLDLLVGAVRFVSGAFSRARPASVALVTQTATLGLRGTDFDVVYAPQYGKEDPGTYVKVNAGGVAVGGIDGSLVELERDQQAFAGNPKVLTRSLRKGPAAVRLDAPSSVFKTDELDSALASR